MHWRITRPLFSGLVIPMRGSLNQNLRTALQFCIFYFVEYLQTSWHILRNKNFRYGKRENDSGDYSSACQRTRDPWEGGYNQNLPATS